MSANPDRERDLILHDEQGLRGRPHGHYFKWRLNAFGFRGPEISRAPSPGIPRILLLGASETFGLYESPGREYPVLLQERLRELGYQVEVVNTAVAGMALPSMLRYWETWACRFQPDLVLVYPSPQFYLDDEPPKATNLTAVREPGLISKSRFASRLLEVAKRSELLRTLRVRFRNSPQNPFGELPQDRIDQFVQDLERLMTAIEREGVRPVLVTHAFKTPSPPERRDLPELEYFRLFFPRATAEMIAAFDESARTWSITLAHRHGWRLIDAAGHLSGRRDLFADPVHFNDAGSAAMADLLAEKLIPLLREGRNR